MNRQRVFLLSILMLCLAACKEQAPSAPRVTKAVDGSSPMIKVRYGQYEDSIDLSGQNILAISGAPRSSAKELFPFLAEASEMKERQFPTEQITSFNGEIADEVHEFTNATQGRSKITRLLLRNGVVIELTVGSGKR